MGNVLMWIGVGVTVIGWIALAWQASKRMAMKDELEILPQKKEQMQSRRNYCLMTIFAGIILLVIAMII